MKIKRVCAFLLILSLAFLCACQETRVEKASANLEKKEPEAKIARLFFVGDVIYHYPVYKNLARNQSPTEFQSHYELMEPYIQKADFALANYEGSVSPDGSTHSYPMFQVPHETLDALKANGFDALSTANNHCLDGGLQGAKKLIDLCQEKGLEQFGTYKDPNKRGIIADIQGVKVGFLSYSQSFNGLEVLAKEEPYLLAPLDLNKVKEDIEFLRPQCDYLLVLPHWGAEYAEGPDQGVKEIAEAILSYGADGIIASHPHVVQGLQRRNDGKFIVYSMGNSLSNQKRQYQKTKRVEGGLALELTLSKREKTRVIQLKEIPTLVIQRQGKAQVASCQDVMDGKISDVSPLDQQRSQELYEEVLKDTTNY